MAQYEIDTEDAAVFVLFGLAAGASVGIANVQLFGYTFQDVITTISGIDLTLATIVSVAALAWVVATNEIGMDDIRDLEEWYYYAVIGMFALVIGIPLVPQVHDFVTSNDLFALGAMLVQSAGIIVVSYEA